jgi:hypothetical protein
MPITTDIQFPQGDVDALFAQMRRAQKELGQSSRESLKWAGATLVRSLAASTKEVKKTEKREIVRNPDGFATRDRRVAKFGVNRFTRTGIKFLPIMYDKRGGAPITEITDPRLLNHKKREIPYKGLAKRSWRFLAQVMPRGGNIHVDGVPGLGGTTWTGGETDPTLKITNRVNYMDKALKGGKAAIENAMGKAARSLSKRIENAVNKQRWTK